MIIVADALIGILGCQQMVSGMSIDLYHAWNFDAACG